MIKHLHKRLTTLYTVTTGTIIAAALTGILIISTSQIQKDQLQQFHTKLFDITSQLQYNSTINTSWLAMTEAENLFLIHIEENTIPLQYPGSWTPDTDRQTLVALAKEQANNQQIDTQAKPISSSRIQSSVFTIKGKSSDRYYGCVVILPTPKGFQSLILLKYRPSFQTVLLKQIPLYFLFYSCVMAGIGFISWYFVGKSLEPVEKSRKRQTRFIAAASHELRSPLAVIESSISAIDAEPQKQTQFLKYIHNECFRMSKLINDMLFLASADEGSWPLQMNHINTDTLLIECYECMESVCHNHGISLSLELPEDPLPSVMADEDRLKQVLSILMDNAISYTPKGKQITLKADFHSPYILIHVSDEGCGMDSQTKQLVFERFYQGEVSRTDKQHFGLGLSIAKELIDLHHGEIQVSDSPSGGSCFTLKLRAEL